MKYGVGIIGYGWVAGAHIDAINSSGGGEVRAVCSSRKLDAAEVSKYHGGDIATYSELADMLADPNVDVVSICSYPDQHVEQAITCAQAGKHMIIEKPIALNLAELKRLETAVAQAGVGVCVCFECRYSSQFLATKSIIDHGLLGRVHYAEVDYYHGIGPWYGQYRWNTTRERGGSSLLSAGCHALDALLLCMGGEVESVTAHSIHSTNRDFAPYEYDTTSVTLVRFKDGRLGKTASVIDCLQPYYFHTHLVGSEGSLLDNKLYSTALSGLDKARWSELSMKMLDSGDVSDHPYETQFSAFFESLKKGEAMPLTSLADAAQSHRVIFAADESARTGQTITL